MIRHATKKSILIINLGSMSDTVISSGLIHLTKNSGPRVRLHLLIDERFAPLMDGHPSIDQLITVDCSHWDRLFASGRWLELAREAFKLRKTLQQQHFDLTLDVQSIWKSAFIAWLSMAKTSVGLGSSGSSAMFIDRSVSRNMGDLVQIGAEYRYLLSQLGMPDTPWNLYTPTINQSQTTKLTEDIGFDFTKERYALLCPTGATRQQEWPANHWQQLALRLRGRYHIKLLIAGSNPTEDTKEIAHATGALDLSGALSTTQNCLLIKHASALIGVDSGLTHLGHAYKVPTIALFGATYPYTYTGQETSKVLYMDLACSPCKTAPICGKRYDCMKELTPDMVIAELKPLMKLTQSNSFNYTNTAFSTTNT
ncbi:glycosyltransferase family 9 protein [Teredinibacter waterburyi]|uniref:glycosyltransferase family 9 protein n=1 Tax=Teredinibacter waterburyi TaxID=1500538 RepID=UPI00165F35B5|nr:glycosyltransferase family 9 protein [Teredinibacter waterburyi]